MKYIFTVAILILVGCGRANTNEGDAYFEDGDYAQAVKVYSDLLSTDPENTQFLYNRGRSYEGSAILLLPLSNSSITVLMATATSFFFTRALFSQASSIRFFNSIQKLIFTTRMKSIIAIASTLKPVDDVRAFEKIAQSIAKTNKYEVNIIGNTGKKESNSSRIHFVTNSISKNSQV